MLTRLQRLLILLLFLLAAWPAWLRGGTPAYTQHVLPWLGLSALLLACFAPGAGRERSVGLRRILRDPLLYIALAFLALLLLQWWNAGRVLFYDPIAHAWTYSAPARPNWPSAFTRPEAAEMIRWFLPAFAAALALRAGLLPSNGIRLLWRLLTLGAAALAAVGLAQQAAGAHWLPYTRHLEDRFFAGFGYENHAASFFALSAALAAGLLARDALGAGNGRRRGLRLVSGGLALALNLAATQMSLSRAGILLGWLLLLLGGLGVIRIAWPRLAPAGRVNLAAGVLAATILLGLLVHGYGHDRLRPELASLRDPESDAVLTGFGSAASGDRIVLARAALDIWRAHPIFGVGGWGYRYLLPYTQPEDGWQWTQGHGKANVHNDPLQFLVEFGAVGFGLLVAAGALVVAPAFRRDADGRRPVTIDPSIYFALLGVALVILHSLIDLPFRSPAILLAAVLAAAGAGVLAKSREVQGERPPKSLMRALKD